MCATYYARTSDHGYETCAEHLAMAGCLAGGFAKGFGYLDDGLLAGLVHDLGKYSIQSMFMRRAAKGQCFHHPYFGAREFPVEFQLWQESGDPVGFEHGHRDLGYMLYDFDYRNPAHPTPLFFRAELDDGVLDVESMEVRS